MNALVLNGARDARDFTNEVCDAIVSVLKEGGWDVDRYILHETEIADLTRDAHRVPFPPGGYWHSLRFGCSGRMEFGGQE
jgi:putative NADPH-quinone reductase